MRLHGITWGDYERLLVMRGESSGVRITYCDGEVEFMNPSLDHGWVKKTIARLLEAWSEESAIDLTGYGSWTVKKKERQGGLEPDECYVVGTKQKERPDLAIEVIWTSGGIDKLEVYRKLGVPEIWMWQADQIEVWTLQDDQYVQVSRSKLLPTLDLSHLQGFLTHPNQTQAVREYRRSLHSE